MEDKITMIKDSDGSLIIKIPACLVTVVPQGFVNVIAGEMATNAEKVIMLKDLLEILA